VVGGPGVVLKIHNIPDLDPSAHKELHRAIVAAEVQLGFVRRSAEGSVGKLRYTVMPRLDVLNFNDLPWTPNFGHVVEVDTIER
jgi:hypothetical protein